MSDSRRSRRPDSHQMWDDADRRDHDRQPPRDSHREREREPRDRRGYRSRSRERWGPGDRSPDRRYRDRDADRGRGSRGRGGGRGRDRGGRDNHGPCDDRDRRDRRRDDDADHHRERRRSASPKSTSPPPAPTLPTRSRPRDSTAEAPPTRTTTMASNHDPAQGADLTPMDQDTNNPPADEDGEVDPDEAAMQAVMGFGGFGSTKGKRIAGNDVGGVRKEKKTEYRQYMNRQGGFNRPLSPSR
ncbi:U4/U6.U5 tri-snRNP-associated protein 3-like protein [Tolypocladium capitatum]|uniref:U4/U6.U5 tri-snRNP-associated protein 3-like protein n=1 Tax=Tolypocladium capitatum TaxID=45235 RepID=A0A2K3QJL4_9HYPO|nr:U4/U6.U5 tri-snRNP-associated protein 3-like protein [Tolypocladium capitatum]